MPFPNIELACQEALDLWGGYAQAEMCMEECAELIVAIRHFAREKITADQLASEIADVEIMCHQMRLLVGADMVEKAKKNKVDRLLRRIEIVKMVRR